MTELTKNLNLSLNDYVRACKHSLIGETPRMVCKTCAIAWSEKRVGDEIEKLFAAISDETGHLTLASLLNEYHSLMDNNCSQECQEAAELQRVEEERRQAEKALIEKNWRCRYDDCDGLLDVNLPICSKCGRERPTRRDEQQKRHNP